MHAIKGVAKGAVILGEAYTSCAARRKVLYETVRCLEYRGDSNLPDITEFYGLYHGSTLIP